MDILSTSPKTEVRILICDLTVLRVQLRPFPEQGLVS